MTKPDDLSLEVELGARGKPGSAPLSAMTRRRKWGRRSNAGGQRVYLLSKGFRRRTRNYAAAKTMSTEGPKTRDWRNKNGVTFVEKNLETQFSGEGD